MLLVLFLLQRICQKNSTSKQAAQLHFKFHSWPGFLAKSVQTARGIPREQGHANITIAACKLFTLLALQGAAESKD